MTESEGSDFQTRAEPWRLRRWGKPSGRALGMVRYDALIPDTMAGRRLQRHLNEILIEASYLGILVSIHIEQHEPPRPQDG